MWLWGVSIFSPLFLWPLFSPVPTCSPGLRISFLYRLFPSSTVQGPFLEFHLLSFSWIRELFWFAGFCNAWHVFPVSEKDLGEDRASFILWGVSRQDPTTGSAIKNVPSGKPALLARKQRELSGQVTFLITLDISQPWGRKGCPYIGGVVSHCVTPDTCVWGPRLSNLASNWAMNQSTQRALFLSKRENIEQRAYVDGVTVSKPGMERDWRRMFPPGGISPAPEGSGDADPIGPLPGREIARIIF